MSRHLSVALVLLLPRTFDVWPPFTSLSVSHTHTLPISVRMSVCTSVLFTLPVALDCLVSCVHLIIFLPVCRFALSLRLTPFPSSASLNVQRPANPVSLSPADLFLSLSLAYSQSRSLSRSLLGCLLLSFCLFSSLCLYA